jgi:hypothetical protein
MTPFYRPKRPSLWRAALSEWRTGLPMLLVPALMWLAAMIGHAFS